MLSHDVKLTEYPCFGLDNPRPLTLSWSKLSDWMKCHRRVALIFKGARSKNVNARNFLAGNLADHSMRQALLEADRDSEGRLLSLSKEQLLAPLPAKWEEALQKPEKGTYLKWNGTDPEADQKQILQKAQRTLTNLHPILEKNVVGHRYIPELRPEQMPVIGIPGPSGETCYIRLFLAVDCAVQIAEDPDNPDGLGQWGLFDLKTTASDDYLTKTLPQLVFYDIAFHALTGKHASAHGLWAPLSKQKERTVYVDDEHRRLVMSWIISYCHGVWAGDDAFTKDDTNCYMCPTKAACPKVTAPVTRDEQGISRVLFGQGPGSGKLQD